MRAGHSLVEMVAAIATGSLLTAVLTATIVVQARSATAIATGAEEDEAFTLAASVLSAETRDLAVDDVIAIGEDSLALRAHRATAIVCDTAAGGAIVRWSGSRGPDPAKDSAIVLRRGTGWTVPIASAVATLPGAGCAPREGERAWRIDPGEPLRPGDVLLVFERGAYHLSTRALRWRAGAAGRQPLTAEIFDDANSGFGGTAPLVLTMRSRLPHATTRSVPLRRLEAHPPW